ncbi:hypothetical protein E4631_01340 [Hymenobacter sp. UV11]|uniref:hypothetical protein n=1 Tax=Hymenobacter sp. UV11 TaxID=1849735 RepID=UPI00105F8FD0|nr:hypothetical protein [Hymenobacter sp. UV11]TDN37542.1 hypothetical protein A8B98_03165 [Hymenobacter sp. UV11]TFZ68737.1 hypothetical protein E4631_01340 [Hymenobacter sp. UV11]
MKFLFVVVLSLGLSAAWAPVLAQEAPRQLGGAPVVPAPAPRQAAPAPRQLDPVPATAPAAITAVPADSTQPAQMATTPAAQPQPAPVAPPAPGGTSPFNRPYVMGGSTQPTRYQVGLKSGALYNVYDVQVKQPLFGRSFLLLDGQRRVELSEVGFYENETGHFVRTNLPGSSREATLRREKTGRISLYATYNTSYAPGGYGMPGMGYGGFGYGGFGGYPYGSGYRTTKTEYFSKDNGPIQNLNSRNLALATTDNAGAQELLSQARRYQTFVVGAYVVGGGLLVAGLLQSLQPNSLGISPLFYAAIPVLIVPLVLQGKQASAQRQAIALYNSTGYR